MNTQVVGIVVFGLLLIVIIAVLVHIILSTIDRKRIQSGDFMPDISNPEDRDSILLAQSQNFAFGEDRNLIAEVEDDPALIEANAPADTFDLFESEKESR